MRSRSLRWFLVGAATATILAAVGAAAVALRRGWILAGDEVEHLAPGDDSYDAEPVASPGWTAGSTG